MANLKMWIPALKAFLSMFLHFAAKLSGGGWFRCLLTTALNFLMNFLQWDIEVSYLALL